MRLGSAQTRQGSALHPPGGEASPRTPAIRFATWASLLMNCCSGRRCCPAPARLPAAGSDRFEDDPSPVAGIRPARDNPDALW